MPADRVRTLARDFAARRRRGRLRAHRLLPRALRHARRIPARRAERGDRQPRPPGRRRVRPRRRSRSTTSASSAGLATYGKVRSRIGDYPDVIGNMPATLLPKEITTPGKGQIRAFFVSRRQPGPVGPGRRRARGALRGARPDGVARLLRQRDQQARGLRASVDDLAGARGRSGCLPGLLHDSVHPGDRGRGRRPPARRARNGR